MSQPNAFKTQKGKEKFTERARGSSSSALDHRPQPRRTLTDALREGRGSEKA